MLSIITKSDPIRLLLKLALFIAISMSVSAQGRGGGRGGPPPPATPKAAAPVDLTGYWVAVVVEDWRYRMLPPTKFEETPALGARVNIPMNAEARKIALAWDPAKDEAAGEQCRAYGAPNIMRIPGRLHITWQDDQTLKLETDAGTQTRLLEFGSPQNPGGGWQGVSTATLGSGGWRPGWAAFRRLPENSDE